MTQHDSQTTYAKAVLEYDEAHEQVLLKAIVTAIAEASIVADIPVMAIRTGEAAQALMTVLACVLAMSPAATRSPAAIRKTIDDFGKCLRRKVAAAETNEAMQDFIRRCFRGNGEAGNA